MNNPRFANAWAFPPAQQHAVAASGTPRVGRLVGTKATVLVQGGVRVGARSNFRPPLLAKGAPILPTWEAQQAMLRVLRIWKRSPVQLLSSCSPYRSQSTLAWLSQIPQP